MATLTEKEIEETLKSPDNLANRLVIHRKQGQPEGTVKIPDEIRKTVAILAIENENHGGQRELAEAFDISDSQVTHFKNGRSSAQFRDETLAPIVKAAKERIQDAKDEAELSAISTLMNSLEVLNPLLSEIKKPKIASSIAKDMAVVSRELSGRNKNDAPSGNAVTLHLHVPGRKSISDYDIVDVTS